MISDNPQFTNEEKLDLYSDLKEQLLITKNELKNAQNKTDRKTM